MRGRNLTGWAIALALFVALVAVGGPMSPAAKAASVDPNAQAPVRSVIECTNGTEVQTLHPAAGFDPFTATDAELVANGLSERPDATDPEYPFWVQLVSQPVHWVTACPALARDGSLPVEKAVACPVAACYANWEGHIAPGNNMVSVRMKWKVSPATSDASAPHATLTQWAGLGNNGVLIQNGVFGSANSAPRFFYEIVGGSGDTGGVVPAPIAVHNNDYVEVQTSYQTNGRAAFYFVNLTTQTAYSPALRPSTRPSPSQAEWITERLDVGGKYTKLAKFPTRAFHLQVAENGYSNPYRSVGSIAGHYPVDMRSCDGSKLLATAGSIGADNKSSNNVWKAYGPLENAGCS